MNTDSAIGQTTGTLMTTVFAEEVKVIEAQRILRTLDPTPEKRIGLALSGGGIRSASFALGVIQALQREERFKDVDYLSTVSGGGYIGASLTWFNHMTKGSDQVFAFGSRGDRHAAAVDVKGEEVSQQPDRVAFVRQHADYLVPSKELTTVSLIAAILRSALFSYVIYSLLITALMMVGLAFEPQWLRWTVARWAGDRIEPSFAPAVTLSILFVVGCCGLGVGSWLYPYFMPDSTHLYKTRVKLQRYMGLLFSFMVAALVLGTLPHVLSALPVASKYLAGISTSTGVAGVIFEFIKQQKPDIAKIWPKVSALVIWVTGGALIYGVLLTAYLSAEMMATSNHACYWAIGIGLGALLLGFFMNSNTFNISRMYRDRLMETFMPDEKAVKSGRWGLAVEADVGFLKSVCRAEHRGPYHLINTNAVLTSSDYTQYHGRGGNNFVLSSLYCGSDATGWHSTESFLGGTMTLATAMAISGAAVNPNAACGGAGPTRNRLVAFMLALFNVRLGYWVRNPNAPNTLGKMVSHLWPNLIYPGIRQGLLGTGLDEQAGFLELTDGGHFENTGIYELIRRRVDCIILSLASADPDYGFDDLADVIERVRVDFGTRIRFGDSLANARPGETVDSEKEHADALKYCNTGYSVGVIKYPDGTTGQLIVLKAALSGDLPLDVVRYATLNRAFPNEATANQFFDERQFEAYREVGYAVCKRMLRDNVTGKWF